MLSTFYFSNMLWSESVFGRSSLPGVVPIPPTSTAEQGPPDRLDRVDQESAQFSCHTESFKWLFEFEPYIVSGVLRFRVIGQKLDIFLLGIYVRS